MKKTKQELINSYSDKDTNHLEPLKHIFYKPTMYLGSTETPQHTIEEALMNSIDEAKIGVAEHIIITFHSDDSFSVQDDGRGIPYEYSEKYKQPTMRALFTLPNTGKAFAGHNDGSSQHGVGMKAVVATSDWFEVQSFRKGKTAIDRYELKGDNPGVPVVKLNKNGSLPLKKIQKGEPEHGTIVRWKPSLEVFDKISVNKKRVEELAHRLAYLNPGLKLTVIDEDRDSKKDYLELGGITSLVEDLAKSADSNLITPVYLFKGMYVSQSNGKKKTESIIKAEVAFAWSDNTIKNDLLFTNNVPNPLGGTPIVGAHKGFVNLINKYANDLNITKENLEGRDVIPGLVLVISLTHPSPKFDGQAKKEITSSDALTALSSIVFVDSQAVIDRNIDGIRDVVTLALKRANERKKLQEDNYELKGKEVNRMVLKKLSDCDVKGYGKNSEFFIVEGDSAGGSIKERKDPTFQAMLPIRGKIINVIKATPEKVFANNEFAAIFKALGCGINAKFDIKKLNYDRIIIATDQDADGAAISCLILSLILKFTPELIKQGHVYRVLTPLFVNKLKNGDVHYTYSNKEQEEFLSKAKNKKNVVSTSRNKGLGELFDEEVDSAILNPATRRLIQFQMDDDNIEECYDIVEKMMGSRTDDRQAIFFDEKLYQ